MNNKAYIERTYRKYDNAINLYARRIFREIGYTDTAKGYETKEHLRRPPEEGTIYTAGQTWGGEYGNIWLTVDYTAPADADGKILCAFPESGAAETLCFLEGKPVGIINSKNDFLGGMHSAMFVDRSAKAGKTYHISFECYAWHACFGTQPMENYGMGNEKVKNENFVKTFRGIKFLIMDEEMKDFCFDLSTVLETARLPGENFVSLRAHECLMNAFPYFIQDVELASDEELHESVTKIRELLAPALVKREGGDPTRGRIGLVGHSHMDTAWLWPMDETVRKCARTYSEALTLMDMYPEYTFVQSSALHIDWMKEYYPDIYEGIKARVAEGRYEPNGGVWVECDCNITGGEAMVRQFLVGQRYTMENLGYRSDSFWLPDTFGYNGAIPQIMLGAGVKYFYTTKLPWADLNNFPEDTFVWRGIDGSEVLTHLNRIHLVPDVNNLMGTITEIRDKHSSDSRLVAYGFGDGGGGPTYGMLEYVRRVIDLDGMPEIKPMTVSGFMKEIDQRRDKFPVYDGELYLEYHRGTLTQMHDVKRNNRKAEIALHDMELFNVLSGAETVPEHDSMLKTLLKNQFHDILPGTCIPKVYEKTVPEMAKLIADEKEKTQELAGAMTSAGNGTVSLYNTLSFDRDDVVVLDGSFSTAEYAAQSYTDAQGCEKTAVAADIPAMEAVTFTKIPAAASESVFEENGQVLETPFYTVTFNDDGYIVSLIDKRVNREVAHAGGTPLGTLWCGEDFPTAYDNWEVEDDIFLKLKAVHDHVSHEVVSVGSVEYRVRDIYRIGRNSTATVDTVFYAKNPRIDYETTLDWHERHQLLKVGFDVNIRSAFVKNEIQFGHIDRPTTRNTSLECAKFEICNHKWSDLSETRYGVAVLNDCKYGLSCEGSDLRLTLHKAGCRPDPFTDNGVHTMVYSLLPHDGPFDADTVVKPAYMLNYAPVVVNGVLRAPKLFSVSAPNILAEAVKNAEDRKDAYVIRLYECERSVTNCDVAFADAKHVYLTNLLEETIEELPVKDGAVSLNFRAFEIKTLLVER